MANSKIDFLGANFFCGQVDAPSGLSLKLPPIDTVGLLVLNVGPVGGVYLVNPARFIYIGGTGNFASSDGNTSGQTITASQNGVYRYMLIYL